LWTAGLSPPGEPIPESLGRSVVDAEAPEAGNRTLLRRRAANEAGQPAADCSPVFTAAKRSGPGARRASVISPATGGVPPLLILGLPGGSDLRSPTREGRWERDVLYWFGRG
jgi:hypothetical protein